MSLARRQGSERSLRRYKGADTTVKRTARPRSIEFVSVVEQPGNFESKENARDPSRLFPSFTSPECDIGLQPRPHRIAIYELRVNRTVQKIEETLVVVVNFCHGNPRRGAFRNSGIRVGENW